MDTHLPPLTNGQQTNDTIRTKREKYKRAKPKIDISDPEREIDYFELFCQQAGRRRLSSSREYGGSLPDLPPPSPQMQRVKLSSSPHNPLHSHSVGDHLTVPSLPTMRRTHSDCGEYTSNQTTFSDSSPKSDQRLKSRPMKIWSSIKSLVDSCEGSPMCLSPSTSPPFERLNHTDFASKCASAPHSRSSSLKRKKRPQSPRTGLVQTSITLDLADDIHPVSSSFPNKSNFKRPNNLSLDPGGYNIPGADTDQEDWERVRHFVITPKGIVNCGDSFRNKSCSSSLRSLGSCGSGLNISHDSAGSINSQHENSSAKYKLVLLGAAAVGKTTLAQQFLTSECLVERDHLDEFEENATVNVLLDGEETQIEIVDNCAQTEEYDSTLPMDATLVVYSTIDRMSFYHATDMLCELRKEHPSNDTIILIANKTDLIRSRQVAEQEGKSAAETYDCKYFEVSALINLRVDELLAGIVNQIRLHRNRKLTNAGRRSPIPDGRKSPLRLINRILKRQAPVSKSCDNLLVL